MTREDSQNFDRLGRLGTAAWNRLKQEKNWNDWMTVGDAMISGREFAMSQALTNKPEGSAYNRAFGEWLKKYQLDDMDASDRAKLFKVMDQHTEIDQWRATLTITDRMKLNHPTAVLRKWQAATQIRSKKKRTRPSPKEQMEQRITELEEHISELEAARQNLTKAVYSKIKACLHPDSRKSLSDERLKEAFEAFTSLERVFSRPR
jgi:hypothetical protein